jgi:hypothetical protein
MFIKNNFLKNKNIILICFQTKNILKNNYNNTSKKLGGRALVQLLL